MLSHHRQLSRSGLSGATSETTTKRSQVGCRPPPHPRRVRQAARAAHLLSCCSHCFLPLFSACGQGGRGSSGPTRRGGEEQASGGEAQQRAGGAEKTGAWSRKGKPTYLITFPNRRRPTAIGHAHHGVGNACCCCSPNLLVNGIPSRRPPLFRTVSPLQYAGTTFDHVERIHTRLLPQVVQASRNLAASQAERSTETTRLHEKIDQLKQEISRCVCKVVNDAPTTNVIRSAFLRPPVTPPIVSSGLFGVRN